MSPDYFFNVPPQQPLPSVLYPIAPMGLGTGDIESLDGYLLRLATAHRITVYALIQEVLLPAINALNGPAYSDRTQWGHPTPEMSGSGTKAQACVNGLAKLSTRQDFRNSTLLWTEKVIAEYGLIARAMRYCPICYEEHVTNGTEAYDRLIWNVGVVSVCPVHSVKLRKKACSASNKRGAGFRRSAGSGHCTQCGMLAYKCNPLLPEPATKDEIWIAGQVHELIAYGASAGDLVRTDLTVGVRNLADQLFNGQIAPLARISQISKSQTWHFANAPNARASLSTLLQLCSAVGCSLKSLLVGKPKLQSDISFVRVFSQHRDRSPVDYEAAGQLLRNSIAAQDGSVSLASIARTIGAGSARSIRNVLPDLSATLVDLGRNHRREFVEKRREAATLECEKALKDLADRKLTPTLRNLAKLTGQRWSGTSRKAKIFYALRRFENGTNAISPGAN